MIMTQTNRPTTSDLRKSPSVGTDPLNESGYFSMNSLSSTEEEPVEKKVIPKQFAPQFMILGEDGGCENLGGYWGASIRSCQLLTPDKDHQFHPAEPPVFYHVVINVIPNSNMEQLHARAGFFFKEISGAPTYEMDGRTFAEKLSECEQRMAHRGSGASFKFLEVRENEEDVYHFVQFKSGGNGRLGDIHVTECHGKSATAETDDDGDIVESLSVLLSDKCIIQRPAYKKDGHSYYIFSNNGNSLHVRTDLRVKDELPGYLFVMHLYYGIYKGNGSGSAISSLQSGDSVYPLVIQLPYCDEELERVIAAERRRVDVRDGSCTEKNIDEDHQVIHQPDPGLFFMKRVEGRSMVLQSTKDKSLYLGIDEHGTLKTIQPVDHYTTDKRLHFRRLLRTQLNQVLEIVHETSV